MFRLPLPFALLAAAASLLAGPGPLRAQEVVAGKPPMYARVEKTRVYISPFTAVTMRLDLGNQPDPTSDRVEGLGLSLGADFIVRRHVALWIAGHAGAVTGVEQQANGATERLSQVRGTFRALGAGAAGVLNDGPWTGMLGLGLFAAAAQWRGFNNAFGLDLDTGATLYGAVATLRGDYTLRNGFFIGLGLDLAGGVVGGKEAEGASSPTGDFLAIYVPFGWTY
jgi:hypothetical protein